MSSRTSLSLAALATLAALPLLAGEPTTTTSTTRSTEHVAMRRIVVSDDSDAAVPEHSVAVFSRAVDGGAPTMSVQLLGKDGAAPESFDVAELAIGETKRFTSDSGREVEIGRTDDGITLAIDGKTIDLPGLSGAGDSTMAWTTTANTTGEDMNVVVAGAPQVFVATMRDSIDFEKLESVKKLRPGIRDEVVAALKEILASPEVLTMHGLPGGAFAMASAPGADAHQQVVVKTIVVDGSKKVQ